MDIRPYLFLSGTCREAFTHYQEILGGQLDVLTMADVPEGTPSMPGASPDLVMHAALRVGDALLMGSDDPTGDGGPMKGLCVTASFESIDESRRVFEALADGGQVLMPFEATFWSPGFGSCIDRFGVPWQIDTMGPEAG